MKGFGKVMACITCLEWEIVVLFAFGTRSHPHASGAAVAFLFRFGLLSPLSPLSLRSSLSVTSTPRIIRILAHHRMLTVYVRSK